MKRGSCRTGLPPACAALLTAVFLLLLSSPVAFAQDLFVVEGVPVDVTAETAAEARERAIAQATRTAFGRMTERLSDEPGYGPPPEVSDSVIQNLVEGIEFADEKSSAVRYLALITVRFRPDSVRSLYSRAGGGDYGRPSVGAGPALLVIPVYEWAGSRVIWEKFNPWWQAWQAGAGSAGGMRIMLPQGDSADAGALTAQQAATGDRPSILAMVDRYSALGAIVARASLDRSGAAPALNLVVTSFGGTPSTMGLVDRVSGAPGDSVDAVASRGVAKVMAMLDEVAQGRAMPAAASVPSVGAASTTVTAALDSPAELANLRRTIRTVVAREELVSLSRGQATLRLFHSGDREALRQSLLRSGVVVTDTPEGWSLSLSGSSGSTLTPSSPGLSGGR